jgi:CheY-like chemotaxis protein
MIRVERRGKQGHGPRSIPAVFWSRAAWSTWSVPTKRKGESVPTILLADDQDMNRKVLGKLLRKEGYQVVEAEDGASALARTREVRPDLVMVDLLMPGTDGFEFVQKLRQEDGPLAHTRVVFISGIYLPDEVRELARACGVAHVLARTETAEEILDAVSRALKSPLPEGPVLDRVKFSVELLGVITQKLVQEVRTLIPNLTGVPEDEAEDHITAQPKGN